MVDERTKGGTWPIDRLPPGLTVVFGDTGSGKSVLLRSLASALGETVYVSGEPDPSAASPVSLVWLVEALSGMSRVTVKDASGAVTRPWVALTPPGAWPAGSTKVVDSISDLLTSTKGPAAQGGYPRYLPTVLGVLNRIAEWRGISLIAALNPLAATREGPFGDPVRDLVRTMIEGSIPTFIEVEGITPRGKKAAAVLRFRASIRPAHRGSSSLKDLAMEIK